MRLARPRRRKDVLDTEYAYFQERRAELFAQAPGKWAVIKNRRLLGIHDTEMEALQAGYRRLPEGPFFVEQILEHQVLLELRRVLP